MEGWVVLLVLSIVILVVSLIVGIILLVVGFTRSGLAICLLGIVIGLILLIVSLNMRSTHIITLMLSEKKCSKGPSNNKNDCSTCNKFYINNAESIFGSCDPEDQCNVKVVKKKGKKKKQISSDT